MVHVLSLDTYTLKRNKNATLFEWKIHRVLFRVLDKDKVSKQNIA